jgi:hypothetical protein
MKRPEA